MRLKILRGLTLVGPLLYSSIIHEALNGPKLVLTQNIKHEIKVAALKHGLEPDLYLSIIKAESSLDLEAYNATTQDTGLAQINLKTAQGYNLNLIRLKHDYKYNLEQGAIILADFRARYQKREPKTWACRYNVGTGTLTGLKLQNCLKYLARLKSAK